MTIGKVEMTCVPMRLTPSDRAEMTNQLLFGERFEVLEVTEKWVRIRCLHDSYEGWIDRKLATCLDAEEAPVGAPLALADVHLEGIGDTEGHRLLPAGSILSDLCHDQIGIEGEVYEVSGDHGSIRKEGLRSTAMYFLNSPYLWGGRTRWGIDCSGFTQIVFRIHGMDLPRDASQQIALGSMVERTSAVEGDLAYFNNASGAITHVGIMLDAHTIIHASGKVRIDEIDDRGILLEKNVYSHELHSIKRIADLPIG